VASENLPIPGCGTPSLLLWYRLKRKRPAFNICLDGTFVFFPPRPPCFPDPSGPQCYYQNRNPDRRFFIGWSQWFAASPELLMLAPVRFLFRPVRTLSFEFPFSPSESLTAFFPSYCHEWSFFCGLPGSFPDTFFFLPLPTPPFFCSHPPPPPILC